MMNVDQYNVYVQLIRQGVINNNNKKITTLLCTGVYIQCCVT